MKNCPAPATDAREKGGFRARFFDPERKRLRPGTETPSTRDGNAFDPGRKSLLVAGGPLTAPRRRQGAVRHTPAAERGRAGEPGPRGGDGGCLPFSSRDEKAFDPGRKCLRPGTQVVVGRVVEPPGVFSFPGIMLWCTDTELVVSTANGEIECEEQRQGKCDQPKPLVELIPS